MNTGVVLPSAGQISGAFAQEAGTDNKALIPFGGRTILEREIAALRATKGIGSIVVVGSEDLIGHPAAAGADAVLHEEDSGIHRIFRGIEWLRAANDDRYPKRVLIVTTDVPFLTPAIIEEFLDACPPDTDICIPTVSESEWHKKFPGAPNYFAHLRDGSWTIGCAFLINTKAIMRRRELIEKLFAVRLSRIGMARLVGIGFIVRLVTRRLTLADIEARCVKILGCSAKAIKGCAPELSFDIDYLEEYRYALACRNWDKDFERMLPDIDGAPGR